MSEKRFAFGKNWRRFIEKNFSQEKVDLSRTQLLAFLGLDNLEGKTFCDIGSGSGLHSLAAWQAGAKEIFSFDYDQESVETTRYLREKKAGSPANWSVDQGSVLDEEYMQGLARADVVYSWGVLHHTGDQWSAIRNAASRVLEGGLFYIALYSADVHTDPPPEFWLEVKKKYVSSTPFRRALMVLWYIWRFDMDRKPRKALGVLKTMYEYHSKRGMSYLTDIRDWLGGWPMEFSRDEDVLSFADEELDMDLVRIAAGEANTEYLFRKRRGGDGPMERNSVPERGRAL